MEGLTRVNALIVPQEAIMQGANGSYVYIVNDKIWSNRSISRPD